MLIGSFDVIENKSSVFRVLSPSLNLNPEITLPFWSITLNLTCVVSLGSVADTNKLCPPEDPSKN